MKPAVQQAVSGDATPAAVPTSPPLSPARKRLLIIVYSVLYVFVGPALIVLNKQILTARRFPYPLALSAFGLVASAVFAVFVVHTGIWTIPDRGVEINARFYTTRIVPIAFCTAGTLATGNAVYMYLSVAFIQMLKSYTVVITLAMAILSGLDTPNFRIILSVSGIAVFTSAAAYGELHFSFFGFCLMMASSFSEATKLTLMQFMLSNKKFSVLEGIYYFSPASAACLLVAVYFMEGPLMAEADEPALNVIVSQSGIFAAAAGLGVLVNFVSYLVLQVTSSTTLKALASARSAGLVLFCAVFLGEEVTALQVFGYTGAICFFAWYNYLRLK
eukprot:m.29503 g.29503  ORF g.29503 m.29503 type:complete len:331 (+) comp9170_c0_seq2:76-1068(+)